MKTLVIVSHPNFEQSTAIRALKAVADDHPDTEVRHLEALYGDDASKIDVAREQAAYQGVDRVVYLFPVHWYNLTPMLKAYLDRVWTWGWSHGGGHALRGKAMQVVCSTGAAEHVYAHDGLIHSTIDEVLTPMKASALYVGMQYLPPLAFYAVAGADDTTLAKVCGAFARSLAKPLEVNAVARVD